MGRPPTCCSCNLAGRHCSNHLGPSSSSSQGRVGSGPVRFGCIYLLFVCVRTVRPSSSRHPPGNWKSGHTGSIIPSDLCWPNRPLARANRRRHNNNNNNNNKVVVILGPIVGELSRTQLIRTDCPAPYRHHLTIPASYLTLFILSCHPCLACPGSAGVGLSAPSQAPAPHQRPC